MLVKPPEGYKLSPRKKKEGEPVEQRRQMVVYLQNRRARRRSSSDVAPCEEANSSRHSRISFTAAAFAESSRSTSAEGWQRSDGRASLASHNDA